MQKHNSQKRAAFHIPGHKGFSWQPDGNFARDPQLKEDLTELPGLDQLAYPDGVIADLEKRAAKIWGSRLTLISVNGATAGIIATLLMLAKRGTHVLVPRGCHRSVVHGLVLSGLKPIWFEPQWNSEWGFWEGVDAATVESAMTNIEGKESGRINLAPTDITIAGIVITSPTYAGTLSDIKAITSIANEHNIPLVVDEAHGTHLLWSENRKQSAIECGADIVIHSLHKNLSCPTQTGLLHLTEKGVQRYGFAAEEWRACLSLMQSSSPSYLFMGAIDKLVMALNNGAAIQQLQKVVTLSKKLKQSLQTRKDVSLYQPAGKTIATEVLIRHHHHSPQKLEELLIAEGVFPEVCFGDGLLFSLGIGSQEKDIEILFNALDKIAAGGFTGALAGARTESRKNMAKPEQIEQVLGPREAFFMPSHAVPMQQAIGEISAECRAPCPPGWPLLVPGQRISKAILQYEGINLIQIVKAL